MKDSIRTLAVLRVIYCQIGIIRKRLDCGFNCTSNSSVEQLFHAYWWVCVFCHACTLSWVRASVEENWILKGHTHTKTAATDESAGFGFFFLSFITKIDHSYTTHTHTHLHMHTNTVTEKTRRSSRLKGGGRQNKFEWIWNSNGAKYEEGLFKKSVAQQWVLNMVVKLALVVKENVKMHFLKKK